MNEQPEQNTFPRTLGARLLLAAGMVGGLLIIVHLVVTDLRTITPERLVHAMDKIEVTYQNDSESGVEVYVDGYHELTLMPGRSETVGGRNLSWFAGRRIEAWDRSGRVVLDTEVDDGELRNLGYRIVIQGAQEDLACSDPPYPECLQAETELEKISKVSCDGDSKRVCLVPMGRVPVDLVHQLTGHYTEEYGLEVDVLTPIELPDNLIDDARMQADAFTLVEYLGRAFAAEYNDPNVVLVGLTSVDLYDSSDTHLRYLLGLKGSPQRPTAVISTRRMDPTFLGAQPDEEVYYSRVRKLISKYIGFLYYNLDLSADPKSPMFDNILSPDDLDRMDEPLPVEDAR